jgi:hypothetical protein
MLRTRERLKLSLLNKSMYKSKKPQIIAELNKKILSLTPLYFKFTKQI